MLASPEVSFASYSMVIAVSVDELFSVIFSLSVFFFLVFYSFWDALAEMFFILCPMDQIPYANITQVVVGFFAISFYLNLVVIFAVVYFHLKPSVRFRMVTG